MPRIGLSILALALLAGCSTAQTPLPTFSGGSSDSSTAAKIDETKLPGGDGKTIRLHDGFVDLGTGQPKSGKYWMFEMEAQSDPSKFTLNVAAPLYMMADKNGKQVGGNILSTIPGVAGYSPYWQVHMISVPDNYVANSIRSIEDVQAALKDSRFKETVMSVAVNCPVVAQNTQLEGASGVAAHQCWYEGKRAYYFGFDTLNVVNGKVATAPIWVFMPKDADPMNPASPSAATTAQPVANYDKTKAEALPFVNQDQGLGNFELVNNIINTWPSSDNPAGSTISTPPYPNKGAYSALWLVNRVTFPDNYSFRSINTVAAITASSSFTVSNTNMLVNCPLLDTIQK